MSTGEVLDIESRVEAEVLPLPTRAKALGLFVV